MKIFVILLFIFFSQITFAKSNSSDLKCGVFSVAGVVKRQQEKLNLVLNEGAQSETVLVIPLKLQNSFLPYISRAFLAEVVIEKTMNGTKGEITKLNSIELRASNPLAGSSDTWIKQIKKEACQK